MKRSFLLALFASVFFMSITASAASLPFTDVPQTASYYDALDSMYGQGIIRDSGDHLFRPNSLIARDEFVSIIVGTGCKKCLYPDAVDLMKYTSFPFLDVSKWNTYFYCISYAKDVGIVRGYILDESGQTKCQNGKAFTQEPFCPTNNIERIEAVGALLRQANLWNESLNSSAFDKAINITDIDNYWYGYAQKGIAAGILSIDSSGKVFPHQYITRKELVEMAWKIYSLNQCQWKEEPTGSDISADIQIFDPSNPWSCKWVGTESTFPDPYSTIYDFYAKTESVGDLEYTWEFTNITTGEVIKKTGRCLDNFDLKSAGKWVVKLTVKDRTTGKSATSIATIDIKKPTETKACSDLSTDIIPDPIEGFAPLADDFTSIVHSSCGGPYTYRWDFWDGGASSEDDPTHTYTTPGTYVVTLHVTDSHGNISLSQVVIVVKKVEDRDHDGVLDADDACPDVYGLRELHGCPKITPFAGGKTSFDELANRCQRQRAETLGGFYLGWAKCTTCPCESYLDYVATTRACDIIFPAITSPDKKTIFARWPVWQLKE